MSPLVLEVAIVGAGPGGLATAIALQKVPNVRVTIYEKASVLREVGAGINIGQNSWNVLELLEAADALDSGHECTTVLNMNGKTGTELSRLERGPALPPERSTIRTQRTKLQSALLTKLDPAAIQLGRAVTTITNLGDSGVQLNFADSSTVRANLVVGADGIRSVVRQSVWPDYKLRFTGTTIWRVLLPLEAIQDLDPRFAITGWWHAPTSHVYFSPVGEELWEIAAREQIDPSSPAATGKVSWRSPVANATVEAAFVDYLPDIREVLRRVPDGEWREFAAFAGPELDTLTGWNNKVVLVGDASHALSGAFGSGAGFAMEDGWTLAQALVATENDLSQALPIFDRLRLPYYARMYAHIDAESRNRKAKLAEIDRPTFDDRVQNKIIREGRDMSWIYQHDVSKTWNEEAHHSRQGLVV